jgi:hypothetical protein
MKLKKSKYKAKDVVSLQALRRSYNHPNYSNNGDTYVLNKMKLEDRVEFKKNIDENQLSER